MRPIVAALVRSCLHAPSARLCRDAVVPVFLLLLSAPCGSVHAESDLSKDFRLPPGFEISEFAGSNLANDIYTLTIDPKGRVMVSGRGYISLLIDDDDDGKADRAQLFSPHPKDGAMGLLAEEKAVFFTGDGGLQRLRDVDGDDRADGPPERIRALKTGDEHTAHAIRRGPDGWLYVLVGNSTDINSKSAQLPTSPIREPLAGAVLRFTPDLQKTEIVADGFRNPYDMDFNRDGELFTHDSDNERCVSLPWYEFTRCYHVTSGARCGWNSHQLAETWRSPPTWLDVAEPVSSIARGSPTGVECYRHGQFPEKYRGALFLLDWTFGKVYSLGLESKGSTYTSKPELFLESLGSNGFAPTDVAVHPVTGDLYLSIGGRGSRGAVFRIRYSAGRQKWSPQEIAAWQPKPTSLDWDPSKKVKVLSSTDSAERRRALETALRHRSHYSDDEIVAVVRTNANTTDRPLVNATATLVRTLDPAKGKELLAAASEPWEQVTLCLGLVGREPELVGDRVLEILAKTKDVELQLAATRLLQIAVGDVMNANAMGTVWEGYSRRNEGPVPPNVGKTLEEIYPTGNEGIDRELSRLMAILELESPRLLETLSCELTPDSHPVYDIHRLIVIAKISGARSQQITDRVARALLSLGAKIESRKLKRDRNWPNRIHEMHVALAKADPNLNGTLLASPMFCQPEHVLFTRAPNFDRNAASRLFLQRIEKDSDFDATPQIIALLGALPMEEIGRQLRVEWRRPYLRPAILDILAREPDIVDRDRFLDVLTYNDLSVVEAGIEALETLTLALKPSELALLIDGYRRIPEMKESLPLRQRYVDLMQKATGQATLGVNKEAWVQWFSQNYPDLAAKVRGQGEVPLDAWKSRWKGIAWTEGKPESGAKVFANVGCTGCHNGGRAVGPMLGGVTKRFSTNDLLTAIVDPNRDVSERYQTELIATEDGNLYQGMVVYEAIDSLILQTGPDKTTRIDKETISERRRTTSSLMPIGLVDKCTDGELADLVAYLASLEAN